MTINEYELVLILRPDLDEGTANEILGKIEGTISDSEGGSMLVRDDWGVRKLAYSINDLPKGRYILEKFLADPNLIIELERRIRLEERIMRFLTVRKPGAVDIETRLAEATEERARLAEEAARRAAEAEAEAQYERDAKSNSNDDDDDSDDDTSA